MVSYVAYGCVPLMCDTVDRENYGFCIIYVYFFASPVQLVFIRVP